jgi:deoxyribodipyrimidine photo-lyase
MQPVIYWFRNDLRVEDNPGLRLAARLSDRLLPVYCHDPALLTETAWGFVRGSRHRRRFDAAALADLDFSLRRLGSGLLQVGGDPVADLLAIAQAVDAGMLICEEVPTPEGRAQVAALRTAGLVVETSWQASLLEPASLPFPIESLPEVFTPFREAVERAGVAPAAPLPAPDRLPPPPDLSRLPATLTDPPLPPAPAKDPRSSFPYHRPAFAGGEHAARERLTHYFAGDLPHTYKATRNGLDGTDHSAKFSPWLANGALSARTAYAALREFEAQRGSSEGTYWIWFELLWRDYFRFLHLKHGSALYRPGGLRGDQVAHHDDEAFRRWCAGNTGEPLVDAGMRELAATGWLSNRMRQIVASALIYDLDCDWRAGAAWFAAQLLDFDPCSNQGNWLYIAGLGTDPRGGRRFNPALQASRYDADGHYQRQWTAS